MRFVQIVAYPNNPCCLFVCSDEWNSAGCFTMQPALDVWIVSTFDDYK